MSLGSNRAPGDGEGREKALEVRPDGFISLQSLIAIQAIAQPHFTHSRNSRKGTPLSPKMGIKRARDFRQDGKSQELVICHEMFCCSISPWLGEHQVHLGAKKLP